MLNFNRAAIIACALASAAPVTAVAAEGALVPAFEKPLADAKAAMMGDSATALRLARDVRQGVTQNTMDGRRTRLTAQWLEGEALIRLNHIAEAQEVISNALGEAGDLFANEKLYADLLRSRASLRALSGDYGAALSGFLKAHDRYKMLGDTRSQAIILQNIGSLYSDARDFKRVMRYYRQANEVHASDPALSLSAHNNIGNALKELGRFEEAEAEFTSAFNAAEKMDSPMLKARILTNIASAQYNLGQYDKALKTVENALQLARGSAPEWVPFVYGVRSQINLAKGRMGAAMSDIERTFKGQDLQATSPFFRDFHKTAYELYLKSGRSDLAIPHLEAFHRLEGQARDLSAQANSALLAARFDSQNRELRISKLSAENEVSEARLQAEKNKVWLLSAAVALAIAAFLATLKMLNVMSRSRKAITAANEKLSYVIQHDGLTGLLARDYFHSLLEDEVVTANETDAQGVLMLIDLDRFKQVNDTYGHTVGDILLKKTADRFRQTAGKKATIGRLGGDEFALFLPHPAQIEDAWEIAQNIIDRISVPYKIEGHDIMIGASIGIATFDAKTGSTSALITNADLALYEAKRQGRGLYVNYNPGMRAALEERMAIENDLGRALENGELSVHYQPIVYGKDGETRCYEALMRWNHPTRGEVSPTLFVPVAEDALLIDRLGAWLLRTACTYAANWEDHVKLTVNVSASQLSSGSFLSTVIEALAFSGLPPQRLVLELTESVVLEMDEELELLTKRLNMLGVTFALDDFGRGYSSLNYIEKMQFSMIKIDRDFVQAAAAGSQKSKAIVSAIVSLAGSLGIDVTAEGIEEIGQAEAMMALGCSCFQGFHYGAPSPSVDMLESVLAGSQASAEGFALRA